MNTTQKTYVKMRPKHIEYAFFIYYKREGNFVIGYVPSFDIMCSAKSKEQAKQRCIKKMSAFFEDFGDLQVSLLIELESLGFKASNPATNKMLVRQGKGSFGPLTSSINPAVELGFEESEFMTNSAA